MRALVTRLLPDGRREKVLVRDWPDAPPPQGNEVRTRTVYSGVTNGTERNDLIKGNYAHSDDRLPAPWGYQNVGEVVECGPAVTTLRPGDIVYSSSDHLEFATFPEDGLVVRLRPNVDRRHAALFGMASVAMRTCRHADIRPGERVLIVGAGVIGQAAAQIAALMGGEVTICDIVEPRLETAREIGAAREVLNSTDVAPEEVFREESFDVVMDFAGAPGMEDRLIGAAKTRGRVMLIAGRFEVRYSFNPAQMREVTIRHNSHFDRSDLQMVHRLTSDGKLKLGPLVQDVVPVDQAPAIYETLRDEPEKLLGTVFVW